MLAQQIKYRMMIDRIRSQGHFFAKVDPLNRESNGLKLPFDRSIIDYKSTGLSDQ